MRERRVRDLSFIQSYFDALYAILRIVCMQINNRQKIIEEVFNSITHGIGAIFAITGLLVFLLIRGKFSGNLKDISFSIFTVSLIVMFVMSVLAHSLSFTKAKKLFLIFDHASIFLLIAGTYSPFALLSLKGISGVILLIVVWLLALGGILFKAIFTEKLKILTLVLYLVMGWIGIVVIYPLFLAVKHIVFILLVLGGLSYSVGTIFYCSKKIRFNHAIWHLFVLLGGALHFFAVYLV